MKPHVPIDRFHKYKHHNKTKGIRDMSKGVCVRVCPSGYEYVQVCRVGCPIVYGQGVCGEVCPFLCSIGKGYVMVIMS